MGQTIGIDLGTTYSAAAVMDATGTPKILTNQDGEPVTPSVVLFQNFGQGDEPLVGVQAKNMATAAPDDVVQYVKRQIGDPDWRFDSSTGQSYTAEEISAIILRRIKAGAEAALGAPVDNAVITVPAYFDDARRVATRQTAKWQGSMSFACSMSPRPPHSATGWKAKMHRPFWYMTWAEARSTSPC